MVTSPLGMPFHQGEMGMKRGILLWVCLFLIQTFLWAFSGDASAGNRLRTLYLRTYPSDQINITKYDVRIVEMSLSDKTVCVFWNVDITSQVNGAMPFTVDFYDRDDNFIGQHEEIIHLEIGTTTLTGRKWLHCPEYFHNVQKSCAGNEL
jgi:hypothetical protein